MVFIKQSILLYQQVNETMRKLKPRSDCNQETASWVSVWGRSGRLILTASWIGHFTSLGGPALASDNILVSF